MTKKIDVKGNEIRLSRKGEDDFISLTDIAKYRDNKRTDYIIQNWLRNRNTIEFLGIWEQLNNPDFNPIEFDGIRKQSGLNSFILASKRWRDENPGTTGNIRDEANVAQFIFLSNLENLNALFINEGQTQAERLKKLNHIAIGQMKLLIDDVGGDRLEESGE